MFADIYANILYYFYGCGRENREQDVINYPAGLDFIRATA